MAKMHGRYTRLYINGYDISSDSSSLEVSQPGDTVDVSGFGQDRKQYAVGLLDQNFAYNGFFNDGATGAHTALKDLIGSAVQFAITYGTAIGAWGYAGSAVMESQYNVSSDISRAVTIVSNLVNNSAANPVRSIQILQEKGTPWSTSGSAASSVDGGAASAAGGRVYLQVFSIVGTSAWTFYLVNGASPTGGTTCGTFTVLTGSAAAPIATSIPTPYDAVGQYTRGSWALSAGGAGTIDFWMGFARL